MYLQLPDNSNGPFTSKTTGKSKECKYLFYGIYFTSKQQSLQLNHINNVCIISLVLLETRFNTTPIISFGISLLQNDSSLLTIK